MPRSSQASLDERAFGAAVRELVAGASDAADTAAVYEQAMPPDQSYAGLRRALERA